MKRLVIAVDCDDVLVRTTPYFIDAYNREYGTKVTLNEAHSLTKEYWGVDADEVIKRMDAFMHRDEYKSLGVSAEEAEVLKALSKYHDLHLVTARKEEERDATQSMLERDLPGVFNSVDLVGWTGSKGEVCKRLGVDVLIDDNARHLHNAVEQGLPKGGAILFGDYPWNEEHRGHDDLLHCIDWPSVKDAIDAIAETSD